MRFSIFVAATCVLVVVVVTHLLSQGMSSLLGFVSSSPIEGSVFAIAAAGQLLGMGVPALLLLRYFEARDGETRDGETRNESAGDVSMRHTLGTHPVAWRVLILSALLGISMQFVLSELASLVYPWFPPSAAYSESLHLLISPKGFFAWLLAGSMVIVVAPLSEELFFRRLLLAGLSKRYGFPLACVLSSIFFGLVHGEPVAILYASLAGLLFAWLTYSFASLWPSLLAHAATNAVPIVLGAFASPELRKRVLDLPPGVHLPISILLPSIGLLVLTLATLGRLQIAVQKDRKCL